MNCKIMNDTIIYLMFGFGLLLAELFLGVEGKCSLARLDEDRRLERTIAYVCIHGDLSDLTDVPIEAEWIEFTIGRLHRIPADAFSKYFNLRRLTFYNCEIRELSPDAFRGLNGLEWLVFSNTKLNVAKANMFKYIPNLKMLTMDSTGLIYIEPQVFKILGKRLETLSLRNNDLDCLSVDDLASMKWLKTIHIDENPWMCDCQRTLIKFFESRKIEQHSLPDKYNIHHRRKRWYTNHYNETYSSLSQSQSSTRVYDCMAVLNYPELPPIQSHTLTPNYDYSYQQKIEWRESTATSIAYLDRLPDEMGWIELFDLRTPTLHRYTFFRFGNTLRSITLKNCGIEFIEPEAFAGLHKLERLTIIGARLRTVTTSWFRDLTRLTDLVLERAFIERFENGALDHLRNLRHLDLRVNRLSCLPQESLQGIISLERLEVGENPWLCSCRRDLESYLIRKQIGYEISNSRADSIGCIEDNEHTTIIRPTYEYENFYNFTKTGRIRWSWGYETRAQKPSRPPPTPQPPAVLETTSPPIAHQSGCRSVSPQHYHHHHRYNHLKGLSYVCTRGTITDIQELPSTVETIIFINSIIHTLRSNIFRKFDGFLRRLEFRDCAIQSIDDNIFSGLRNLEDLVINDNDIEVVRPEWFREIPTLRHLDLARNNIGRIENGVFDMLPNLNSIDISDNDLNCIGIERLENLKYLREVNIVGNPWTCLCATRFARFINERNIYCAGNCLNAILESDGISSWGGCHSTGVYQPSTPRTTARPATSTVTPSLYPHILQPAGYTNTSGTCSSTHEHTHYHCSNGDIFLMSNVPSNVRSIEIYDSYIPHLPAASFARFENLTELILRNCSLRDIDPRAFQGLHRLEKLVIRDNRLSIVRNSWFKDCDNLYWLDLSKNNLAEIETGAFDNLKQLQYLNLEDNVFECIYTSYFIHLPRLDTFEFSRNPLKWRCWQDIRQFLEIRAIGYTYYKCPHNSRDLIKTLQDNSTHSGTSTRNIEIVGFIILTALSLLINVEKTLY